MQQVFTASTSEGRTGSQRTAGSDQRFYDFAETTSCRVKIRSTCKVGLQCTRKSTRSKLTGPYWRTVWNWALFWGGEVIMTYHEIHPNVMKSGKSWMQYSEHAAKPFHEFTWYIFSHQWEWWLQPVRPNTTHIWTSNQPATSTIILQKIFTKSIQKLYQKYWVLRFHNSCGSFIHVRDR